MIELRHLAVLHFVFEECRHLVSLSLKCHYSYVTVHRLTDFLYIKCCKKYLNLNNEQLVWVSTCF